MPLVHSCADDDEADPGECLCEDCLESRRRCDDEEQTSQPGNSDGVLDKGRPLASITVPVLRNRASRPMSFEQEFSDGRRWLAGSFYVEGITSHSEVNSYHSGMDAPCYLEDDGSVDVEVIWSMLDLAGDSHPRFLAKGQNLIRTGIKAGAVKLGYNCGFHVHVGLHARNSPINYSNRNVESLFHLWNHVEDTIYRLGSANWGKHRDEVNYSAYAAPTRKDTSRRDMSRNNLSRECALNFTHFLSSNQDCGCGSVEWGVWEECTCPRSKPTVEFRVFNGTANARKIRAYAALCLALVEKARLNTFKAEDFHPFAWAGTNAIDQERSRTGLDFVLNLPLSKKERGDILYCAERSSLKDILSDKERQLI